MYRTDLDRRHKSGALAAVAGIHAALLFALLNLSGTINVVDTQRVLNVFDVTEPPPVEEIPPPPPPAPKQQKAPEKEGGAAPENIRSRATPVVAPEPRVQLPVSLPVPASETPNTGSDPTQGASDRAGSGTGAGGTGTGTGSGGSGSGTGGGGGGEPATPVRLLRGITNRDYPVGVQRAWPRGGMIFLRLRIQPNGRPSQCDVMRSFGNAAVDQWTCRLVMERGVFQPAKNKDGVPVAAWFGYRQSETGRFDR